MTTPVLLGTWPTPLEPAPRLAVAIGLNPEDLWIKRDDLVGLGGGGNKARKLQYLCAMAIFNGATMLVTTGAAQSNHARLTAAAGARLGLKVTLVLAGEPPTHRAGNLILDGLFGADIVWSGDAKPTDLAIQVTDRLTDEGETVELIPFGGSNHVGARGYIDCANELLDQLPNLHHVVTALGSGGTMAGLVDILTAPRVLGIHVGAVTDPRQQVMSMLCWPTPAADLRIRLDQVGAGYPTLTQNSAAAITLAARTEGIVLDPIYTGRAMAGLIAAVQDGDIGRGEPTVFVHTGGLPGLFGHPQAEVLAAGIADQ